MWSDAEVSGDSSSVGATGGGETGDVVSTAELTTGTLGTTGDDSGEGVTSTLELGTSSGGVSSSGVDAPVCGDAVVDDGEECDEGAANGEYAPCTHECSVAYCGDGFMLMNADDPEQNEECDEGVDNAPDGVCTEDCELRALAVFVTSIKYKGNLIVKDPLEQSGLDGADRICQGLAGDAGIPQANLFLAWLSDGQQSPYIRFVSVDEEAQMQPYALLDGTKVADDWHDLTDGTIDYPINVTELWIKNGGEGDGLTVDDDGVWSNTSTEGHSQGVSQSCNLWTSDAVGPSGRQGHVGDDGDVEGEQIGASWTQMGSGSCSTKRRLYCFEQPMTGGG